MRIGPVIAFAAAFAAVALSTGALVPWPEHDELAARVEWFADHADEFDLLYLGASNFRLGLNPQLIDERLAARGVPVHSLNLAAEGMNSFEIRHLLVELLSRPPEKLRWVVIELLYTRPDSLIGVNRFSDRVVSWHTPARSLEVLETLRRAEEPGWEGLRLAGLHLLHTGWRLVNLGQGERIVASLWSPSEISRAETGQQIEANRGFRPLGIFRRQRSPEAESEFRTRWEQALRGFEASRRRTVPTDVFDLAALDAEVSFLRERGIEPIYVIPPVGRGTPLLDELGERGQIPHLLTFNRPKEFPELYRFENRQDLTHVNARGARAWSRLLADRLAGILAGKPPE